MKKILMIARDMGGANALASIYEELIFKGYTVIVFGKEVAKKSFDAFNIPYNDLDSIMDATSYEKLEILIENNDVDIVITGTSAQDYLEKYVWQICNKKSIKTIAIVDQWFNMDIRFSKNKFNENINNERDYSFLPNKILVMDNYSKETLVDDGVEEDKVYITGQPYLEYLVKKNKKANNIGKDPSKKILFISQPISELYNGGFGTLGYNEFIILDEIIAAILNINTENNNDFCIYIRQHPNEYEKKFERYLCNEKIKVSIDNEENIYKSINNSSLVIGMFSMVLLEAYILKKPILSIQTDLKMPNKFLLDILGISKSITNKFKIKDAITEKLFTEEKTEVKVGFVENAINNVIKVIEEDVWEN